MPKLPSLPNLSFMGKQCLAVEFVGEEIRAALVRTAGKRKEILDFLAIAVEATGDELPAIPVLQEIRQRLNCKAGTEAVFVSPLARTVNLTMNHERVRKMRRHVLAEAAKWEAEIYSGIPGAQALSGVEKEQIKIEPGQVQQEIEEIMVTVAVMERNIYQAIKERFRLSGVKLVRVYAPESCFHVPLLEMHEESDRGVMEIGTMTSGFALLRGGETLSINTMTITAEMIREHLEGRTVPDLEETLRYNLKQAPAPHPVALTGAGAVDAEVVRFLRGLAPGGVEPLVLRRAAGLTAAGEEESPAMATVVGAGFRELGGKEMQYIGISDSVPTAVRVRQSVYLMPVAAASLLFVILLGHNLLMRFQEGQLNAQRAEIQAQLDERRQEQAEITRLQNELRNVSGEISTIRRQLGYIQEDWDKALRLKIGVYEGLSRLLPETVALANIRQDTRSSEQFTITGMATSAAEILEFALRLQTEGVAKRVEVQRLERQQQSGDRGVSHRFVMRLEAIPDGA
ncbi:PilN domain-containing protein [Desulfonatronum thioautotrophicum]|uniref:PilN domain-containing protein n=1 Tax=Desulfonatronum thioautotrophicum TaxID=617001 RepID=UPI0005EAF72F|nr:PilN domain-containing protein [Desulfonatronum thioautotrophicum]